MQRDSSSGSVVTTMERGKYVAATVQSPAELDQVQVFRAKRFGLPRDKDDDPFDALCTHITIKNTQTNELMCCFRLHSMPATDIVRSYSGQFYDLSALRNFKKPTLEVGRFCVTRDSSDPDIVRLAWAVITDAVDRNDIGLLFGCTSFGGTDHADYTDVFAYLHAHHLAPSHWRPGVKAEEVIAFDSIGALKAGHTQARRAMPPLLKTYLIMGGWVSDHAVVDPHMNTIHIFTGVEVAAIPQQRKKLLRAL